MKKLMLILALAAICSPLFVTEAQAAQAKVHKGHHHHHHHGKHHKHKHG